MYIINNTVSFIPSQEASRFALTIGKSGKSNLLLFARGDSIRKGKGKDKKARLILILLEKENEETNRQG